MLESLGKVVTVPIDPGEEYGIKLDSGEIIFDLRDALITSGDLETLSTSKPIL